MSNKGLFRYCKQAYILRIALCLSFAILLAPLAHAQTWNGSVSSDWTDLANWNGSVPTSTSTVTIPGNVPHDPVITSSVTIRSLNVGDWNNPAVLTVDGGSLVVERAVALNDYGKISMLAGSIHFDNTGNYSFSWAYTDAAIELISGTFTSDLNLQVNSSFHSGGADVTTNGSFTISTGKMVQSGSTGTWTINNGLSVLGTLDLNGASLNMQSAFSLSSGGVFYGGTGTHDFNMAFNIENNATFHGENAYCTIVSDIQAKNDAYLTTTDGTLEFKGNVDLFSTGTIEILGIGAVIINGTGEFKQDGNLIIGDGSLQISGDVNFKQGGSLNISSGSVDISGSASFSQSGTMNVETGAINIGGDAQFSQSGTFNATEATISVSGNLTLESSGSTFNAGGSTINLMGGSFTNGGTFNADSSTVNLSGGSDQTINGDVVFYNVNVETEGQLEVNGNIVVLNNAVIDSSATVSIPDPNNQINVQGDLTDPNNEVISVDRPMIRNITYVSANEVMLEFSVGITLTTAENTGNYSAAPDLSVTSAIRQNDHRYIQLTFAQIQSYVEYEFLFVNLVSETSGDVIGPDHKKRYTHIPQANPPEGGATGFTVVERGEDFVQVQWVNSTNEGALVVVRMGGEPVSTPVSFINYAADPVFGQGEVLNEGEFVAYSDTGSGFTLTGLKANRNYYFNLYPFNIGEAPAPSYNPNAVLSDSVATVFRVVLTHRLYGPSGAGDNMNTALNAAGLIPLDQPFNNPEFNYAGFESVASIPSPDIVDWVLVTVRHANSGASASEDKTAGKKALFLKSDGSIVDLDGISAPVFEVSHAQSFVVLIEHRNHLPTLSADTLGLDELNNLYALDLTNNEAYWHGDNSYFTLEGGIIASPSGRFMSGNTYTVTQSVYSALWAQRNNTGYVDGDVDLDGYVSASDRVRVFNSGNASVNMP